ncbi:MAG: oligosaccharide flippase family protein [Bacteroidetes bacterium]|nr:oligosaccharide flippase family protein [Bacteroidota bacterium]
MGIIEKQATKNAIYSYLGAGLGFITVMTIGNILTLSENGVLRILVSYAALFSQFANLGFTSVTIRFFPYFRNKDTGHHGFLFYALVVTLIGFLLCYITFLFFQPQLIESNQSKSPLFITYLFYLMPLTFFTVFFNILDSYLRASYNSVIGSFTKEFLQRILILILLLAFFLNFLEFKAFILFYISFTCLPTLMLVYFIIKQKEWHIKPVRGFLSKELRIEMLKLSFYSILAGGAGAIIVNIDAIMVTQILGEEKTGIYGIAFYFGTIILIPARSLYRIMSSVVAENFKENKIQEIHKLYKQSCNSQLAIGILLYIGICANIDNIMHLLRPDFASGRNVILIVGAGYLIEMATGINQVILANSKYYRYDTFFVIFLVLITIASNWILIPIYGITGSAIASAITVTFGNALRYLLLYSKYKMQPYNINTLKLILIAVVAILPGLLIPYLYNLYLDIVIRSLIVGGLFILLLLKTEAAPEINNKIRKNLKRLSVNI